MSQSVRLVAEDVEVIMEGFADLLYLEGRPFAREVSFSKVRLAEREVEECPSALTKNPATM
jgi:hypothetical protein